MRSLWQREYDIAIADRDAIIADLHDTVDRVRGAAEAISVTVDSEPLAACRARVKQYAKLLSDGAGVAATCSAELRSKDTALKACVKQYEDVRNGLN